LKQAHSQRVGDGDVARPQRFQQTRHAKNRVVAQFQRVAKIIVHAAEDHVDLLQAAESLEIHPVIAHRQVLALHHHVTQVARQIALLEVSFAVRSRR
jgi:hypothetical protein